MSYSCAGRFANEHPTLYYASWLKKKNSFFWRKVKHLSYSTSTSSLFGHSITVLFKLLCNETQYSYDLTFINVNASNFLPFSVGHFLPLTPASSVKSVKDNFPTKVMQFISIFSGYGSRKIHVLVVRRDDGLRHTNIVLAAGVAVWRIGVRSERVDGCQWVRTESGAYDTAVHHKLTEIFH